MITRAEREKWNKGRLPITISTSRVAPALDAADALREALIRRGAHAPKEHKLFMWQGIYTAWDDDTGKPDKLGPCENCEAVLAAYDAAVEPKA